MDLIEKVKEVFSQHPEEQRVHVTRDGSVFLDRDHRHALNHSNTIGGEITVVDRAGLGEEEPHIPEQKGKVSPEGILSPENDDKTEKPEGTQAENQKETTDSKPETQPVAEKPKKK